MCLWDLFNSWILNTTNVLILTDHPPVIGIIESTPPVINGDLLLIIRDISMSKQPVICEVYACVLCIGPMNMANSLKASYYVFSVMKCLIDMFYLNSETCFLSTKTLCVLKKQ